MIRQLTHFFKADAGAGLHFSRRTTNPNIWILVLTIMGITTASAQYVNIPVTGFNNDIIANGVGTGTAVPGVTYPGLGLDGAGYYFIDGTYKYAAANALPTCSLPASQLIPSTLTPGLTYSLQSYSGNNALTIDCNAPAYTAPSAAYFANSGTLTLSTPASYSRLHVLYETVQGGSGPFVFNATVTFTDASTQVFNNNAYVNWFTNTGTTYPPASSAISRTDNSGVLNACTAASGPYLFEAQFALSPANYGKQVQSITFSLPVTAGATTAGSNNYFHAMAVGGQTFCAAPVDQATAFTAGTITANSVAASFTAAASAPSGYLVVRYPNGATPTNPADYTSYTIGQALGLGTVVQSGTSTSIIANGLNGGTAYDFYVYDYNSTGCGGPAYNTTSPLMSTQTTSACGTMTGTYSVGPTGTYTSIGAALAALATNGMSGAVILELQAAYVSSVETYPLNVGLYGCMSATNTLTLRPETGATALSITNAASANPVFNVSGANYFTIDGRPGGAGTNQLTIKSDFGAVPAIQYQNDASYNTVKYCTVASGNTATTSGTIAFLGSTGVTGNDYNVIDNCTITQATANAANGVYSAGQSATVDNNNNSITNCNIQDYFSAGSATAGILVGANNTAWTITNNKLFQSASRIYTTANTHFGISIASGSGYTITGNTIGYANTGGTGLTVMQGGTVTGTFPSAYTSSAGNATRYIAINAAFAAAGTNSTIQGNTIGGFALYTSSGAATTNGIWCGVNVTAGNVTINNNTIGSATGQGGVYTVCTTTGGAAVGIYVTSANIVSITNNNIGGFDAMGTGVAATAVIGQITGIDVAGAANYTITGNNIGNTTADNMRTGTMFTGANLSNTGTFGTINPTSNGAIVGIRTTMTGNVLNISTNTLSNWATAGTTSTITGITSSGAMTLANPTVTVSNNALGTAATGAGIWVKYYNAVTANTGILTGIACSNSVAISHTYTNNNVTGIAYSNTAGVFPTGSHTYMNFIGGTNAGNVTLIDNNTFSNLSVYTTTGATTFLSTSYSVGAGGTQTVNNNRIVGGFTKTGATTGSITGWTSGGAGANAGVTYVHTNNNFSNISIPGTTATSAQIVGISNSDGSGAGITKTVSGNTITNNTIGGTTGTGANFGIQYLYHGGTETYTNNTVTGLTGCAAVVGMNIGNTSGVPTLVNIYSNTINTLSSVGTGGTVNAIQSAVAGTTVNVYNHTLFGLSTTGASVFVGGVNVSGGTTVNVYNNTINTLSASGATTPVVNGVIVSGGTNVNVYKNKIYDLAVSSAYATPSATLYAAAQGISLVGGTNVSAYNNTIGDVRAPIASQADAVRGITVNSIVALANYNVYYNTVYLNATSTGTNFGSTGIFHAASATATTAALTLRNNIIINNSTANGTGLNVAFRRSVGTAGTLANYASASNNNLFYAGAPTATYVIYSDGTANASTMTDYQTSLAGTLTAGTVAPRDAFSFTEAIVPASFFQSTTGSAANYLRLVGGITTQCESGASNITSPAITDDVDGDIRQGNAGYAGTGTSPDVGADEFVGVSPAPAIALNSVTPPTTMACVATNRLVSVNVTTTSGTVTSVVLSYSHNGVAQTPVTMTNTTGTTWEGTMIAPAAPSNATVAWGVLATNSLGLSTGYTGTSYSDNPLLGIPAVLSALPTTVCSGENTVLTSVFGTPAPTTYVVPPAVTNATTDEDFGGILITQGATTILSNTTAGGSLVGTIGTATGTAGSYSDFTAFGPYALSRGATYNFVLTSITQGGNFGNRMAIWIDYNGNGVYTDAGEAVYAATASITGPHTETGSFTVPASAVPGRVRMRVLCNEGAITGPTQAVSWGEYEEYMLDLAPTVTAIDWQLSASSVGTTNPLTTAPTNLTAAPVTNTYTANITALGCVVTPAPTVNVVVNDLPAAPTTTPAAVAQCGTAVPGCSASGGSAGNYRWYTASTGGTAIAGETNATLSTYTVSASTTLYVAITNGTCESLRTPVAVTVTTPDAIVATTTATGNVCANTSINLTVTQALSNNTYALSWTASPSVGSGVTAATAATLGTPLAVTPTAAGTYIYTITGTEAASGCATTATATVTVIDPWAGLTIQQVTATNTTVCEGSPSTLGVNLAKPGTGVLGAGALTSNGTGTPFYGGWGGTKVSYIYTAAELAALGFTAGNFTSLGLNVTVAGATTYNGFTIQIGQTTTSTFATANILPVTYTPVYYGTVGAGAGYTATVGLNTFAFGTGGAASSFAWDGTSNLVVTMCYSNATTSNPASTIQWDNTGVNRTMYIYADNQTAAAVCGATTGPVGGSGAAGMSVNRPKTTWEGNKGTLPTAYSWYEIDYNTGLGLTPFSTAAAPVVNPTLGGTGSPARAYAATVTEATGCPLDLLGNYVEILVNPLPTAPTKTDNAHCGLGLPLCSVSSTGIASPIYSWYAAPSGGTSLQSSSATTYGTPISATTTFHVSVNDGTCESLRTAVTETVTTPDVVTATANTIAGSIKICTLGSTIDLTANKVGTTNTYTYEWAASPATGSGMAAPVTGQTVPTFSATAFGTYTYTVTATDASLGCVTTSPVTVMVSDLPVITATTATPNPVCLGSTASLSAVSIPAGAGTAVMGVGGTTQAGTGLTPFSQAWESQHTQYLIPVSMLTAGGLVAGNLTSLSFNVTAGASTLPFTGYTVKMANTTATAPLTALLSPTFTTVYGPVSEPAVNAAGTRTLTFSTPFTWDGTSSVLVDICFATDPTGTGGVLYTSNSTVTATTMPSVHVFGYYADNTSLCGSALGTNTTSTALPVFTFGGQVGVNLTSTLNWAWSSGATTSTTTVSPATTPTTTYTVTATNPTTTCASLPATLNVTVNTAPGITTNPVATSACPGTNATFTVVASAATPTYQWRKNGAPINPAVNTSASTASLVLPAVSAADIANYDVQITECGVTVTSTAAALSLYTLPTITIAPTPATALICGTGSVTLLADGAGTGGTYTWTPTTALTPSNGIAASVVAAPTVTTAYTVTGVDANGCTGTANQTVTVAQAVVMNSSSATPNAFCAGGNSVLTASAALVSSAYCTANATATGVTDNIANVTFAGINNNSANYPAGGATANASAVNPYSNYTTGTAANVTAGSSYTLGVQQYHDQGYYGTFTTAHFDWNQDGDFADANETYSIGASTAAGAPGISAPILVPAGANNGPTRMRIVLYEGGSAANPFCGTFTYGEVEDYKVIVTGGVNGVSSYDWTPSTFLSSTSGASVTATAMTASTTYTVTASAPSGCTATANVAVTVYDPSTAAVMSGTTTVCGTTSSDLSVAITGGASPYSLVYSDGTTNTTVAPYTSGTAIPVSPTATTSYNIVSVTTSNGCVGTGNTGTATITVNTPATAAAGMDNIVCGTLVNLSATANGAGTWSAATGSFTSATSTTTDYTAASAANQTVTLTWTTTDPDGAGPCPAASDNVDITFNTPAIANAGTDQIVCGTAANISATTNGTGTWTAASGSFGLATDAATAFTATSAANQTETLTWTTVDPDGTGPCTSAMDMVDVTFNTPATADAGMDKSTCPLTDVALAATGTGTWTTSAAGTLSSTSSPTATYTPSGAEAGTNVTFTWNVADPDGTGPCVAVSDNVDVIVSPFSTTVPPTNGSTWAADFEYTDAAGWTHYYNKNGTANDYCDDLLLLSLKKNGNTIGTIGTAPFAVEVKGVGGATHVLPDVTAPANYVSSADWWVMSRYWEVTPTAQPTSDINVKFYYKTADYATVSAALPSPLTGHTDLKFFKINNPTVGTYDANPTTGHLDIPKAAAYGDAGYWQYNSGASASTADWAYTALASGDHSAEYVVAKFSGGGGGGGSQNGAFPVDLLSFDGFNAGKVNILNWITTTETNFNYFEVMRSTDNNAFAQLGTVQHKGVNGNGAGYSFTDTNPASGVNYYRLNMVDINGNASKSNIVEIMVNGDFQYAVHPNPASDKVNITLSGFESKAVVSLNNALGQTLQTLDMSPENGNVRTLDISELAKGVYFYQIQYKGKTYSGKLVKE